MSQPATRPPRLDIAALQAEYGGCWVAIRDQAIVDARRNPYELVESLHRSRITGAMILRVPAFDEPETIGMG